MKKSFFMVAVTALVCGLLSCGNSTSKDEKKDSADVKDKKEVVDNKQDATSQCDDATQEQECVESGTARGAGNVSSEGFGRCFESGCYCKEFKGRGQTCANCGHAYRQHY